MSRTEVKLLEDLYQMLCSAASKGLPCPPRAELGLMLGVGHDRVTAMLGALEGWGRIRRVGGANQWRQVEIVETGARTAAVGANWKQRRKRFQPAAPDTQSEAADAIRFLRRRGYVVHATCVARPGTDPSLWTIDSRHGLTTSELLQKATDKGWKPRPAEQRAA